MLKICILAFVMILISATPTIPNKGKSSQNDEEPSSRSRYLKKEYQDEDFVHIRSTYRSRQNFQLYKL